MMSCMTLFILSPNSNICSRNALWFPSRPELRCSSLGHERGTIRAGLDHRGSDNWERVNRLVVAKAGIGRYSGAVHGSNTRRARRRKQPVRPEEYDNARGDEVDLGQDDKIDGNFSELDDTVHDDGKPTEDRDSSYKRYLSELRVVSDTESGYQTHACKRVTGGSRWVPVGGEGDLGYPQLDENTLNCTEEEYVTGDVLGEGEQVERFKTGVQKGDDREENESKSTLVGKAKLMSQNKIEGESIDNLISHTEECYPVAATVVSNPELFTQSSSEEDKENGVIATTERDNEGGYSDQLMETRRLNVKEIDVTTGTSEKSKKRTRKSRKKSGTIVSVTSEFASDDRQVRVVEGEAEQPCTSQDPSSSRYSVEGENGSSMKNELTGKLSGVVEPEASVMADFGPEVREGDGISKEVCEVFNFEYGSGECSTNKLEEVSDEAENLAAQLVSGAVNGGRGGEDVEGGEILDFNSQSEKPARFPGEGFESKVTKSKIGVPGDRNEEKSGDIWFDETIAQAVVYQADSDSRPSSSSNGSANTDDVEHQHTGSLAINMRTDSPKVALGSGADSGRAEQALLLTPVVEKAVQVVSKVVEVPSQVVKAVDLTPQISKVVELPAQVASKVVDLPGTVVEQATQVGTLVVEQVVEILPNAVSEQVGQVVSQVVELQTQVSDQVSFVTDQVLHLGQMMVDHVSEAGETVVEQVSATAEQVKSTVDEQITQVAESVTNTASSVVEQVTAQVVDIFSNDDDDDESDSDDEFESYKTSDDPAFRGTQGLSNFVILQEDQGVLAKIYGFYTYMLKQPLPEFAAAMFSAPIIVSLLFTLLYLPEFQGLAFDETARDFFAAAGGDAITLQMSWRTVFQVFMFSLSLSTGLQPELAPLSPYTLVVANVNALVAQLVFVFLSGAVFARLSQPAQPVRCSTVALVSTSPAQRKRKENAIKVLMARYVLAGPQPCELVDVKVDLTYKYNTITRTGSYFRATQSLKLVRPEIAFLTHGMLVRHVIDSSSPLYQRTPEMLKKEDAVFVLSVVGLERASMQSVFHVQHYCVCDNHVIWDAEFEDLILISSKKNKRIVDHTRLSLWRSIKV